MAGKISALCLNGAEKAVSASMRSPIAIATEPIRPDVSTDNIKGSCACLLQLRSSAGFSNACSWPGVPVSGFIWLLLNPNKDIRVKNNIVLKRINQIFPLPKAAFVYKQDSGMTCLEMADGGGGNIVDL